MSEYIMNFDDDVRHLCEKICYELYKIDWLYSHTSKEQQSDNIKNYFEDILNENIVDYTYKEYLDEFGYNSEIYASFEEFMNNEWYDVEYMKGLIGDCIPLLDMYDCFVRETLVERE